MYQRTIDRINFQDLKITRIKFHDESWISSTHIMRSGVSWTRSWDLMWVKQVQLTLSYLMWVELVQLTSWDLMLVIFTLQSALMCRIFVFKFNTIRASCNYVTYAPVQSWYPATQPDLALYQHATCHWIIPIHNLPLHYTPTQPAFALYPHPSSQCIIPPRNLPLHYTPTQPAIALYLHRTCHRIIPPHNLPLHYNPTQPAIAL